MAALDIREMAPEEEYFVSTCSHVNESEEIDRCGQRRLEWMRAMRAQGLRVFTARLAGKLVGFAYLIPIEVSPLGPIGRDIAVIPCLWVVPDAQGQGAGRALMEAAGEESRRQGSKGIATTAVYSDFWFMPAAFFEKLDYSPVRRRDNAAILWKRFETADRISSSPAVSATTVYIGSLDGNLYALDAATGRTKWKFETDGPLRSSPALAEGIVFIGSDDGHLCAVR